MKAFFNRLMWMVAPRFMAARIIRKAIVDRWIIDNIIEREK